MKTLRAKPSNMGLKKDTYTTDEVRADRGISDVRHGMRKVEGSIEGDLMLGDWDDFLQGALQGTWSNKNLRSGTTLRSYVLEQAFPDLTTIQYRLFFGCSFSKMKLTIKPGSMVGISFDILGQDATAGTVQAINGTIAAGTSSPVSYAGGTITEGGVAIAYVTGCDINLDNGIGQVGVIGSNTSPATFNGRSAITGTITALFKDLVLLNKFLNETESSLNMTLVDPVGGAFTINLPRIKYTGAEIAPPKDGATIMTLPFTALHDNAISSAAGTTLAISAAAPTTTALTATLTKAVGGSFVSFVTEGFNVGDIITLKNATTPGNNGDWVVSAVSATVLTVVVPVGSTMVSQTAGAPGSAAGDISLQSTNIGISRT
jgi:hypothetical protein